MSITTKPKRIDCPYCDADAYLENGWWVCDFGHRWKDEARKKEGA